MTKIESGAQEEKPTDTKAKKLTAEEAKAMLDRQREDKLKESLSLSGFPLQIALKFVAMRSPRGWLVRDEHPWIDPFSGPEFVDLVAEFRQYRLVIEAKRSKDSDWLFIRESTDSDNDYRSSFKARIAGRGINSDWYNIQLLPSSPIATFCVIRSSSENKGLLESTAAQVTRAIDALWAQEVQVNLNAGSEELSGRVYIPMIVTNARLRVVDADFHTVDLSLGDIPEASIAEQKWVRFTKAFDAPSASAGAAQSMKELVDRTERTVMVVQAKYFEEFLNSVELMRRNNDEILQAILT